MRTVVLPDKTDRKISSTDPRVEGRTLVWYEGVDPEMMTEYRLVLPRAVYVTISPVRKGRYKITMGGMDKARLIVEGPVQIMSKVQEVVT